MEFYFWPFSRTGTAHPPRFDLMIMSSELVKPIQVEAHFKSWVFARSLAANVGSNPAGIMDVCIIGVLCAVR